MKNPRLLAGVFASVLCVQSAFAQLPALNDAPWLGYNAVFANKRFQFGVTSAGKITLTPFGEKSELVSHALAIDIIVAIEETLPTGQVVVKQVQAASLASAQPATAKLEKTVITGKVTGDASFELTIEQNRGLISMGGRLVEPGTLKNPLRFTIRAKFPTAYPYDKTKDKKEEKAFQKKLEDDRIDLKWTDGKRKKQDFAESVPAPAPELNGPGLAAAQIEISAYKGKKFMFLATENSMMTLEHDNSGPLHTGFSLLWAPDAVKDKDGKARFSFEVK